MGAGWGVGCCAFENDGATAHRVANKKKNPVRDERINIKSAKGMLAVRGSTPTLRRPR